MPPDNTPSTPNTPEEQQICQEASRQIQISDFANEHGQTFRQINEDMDRLCSIPSNIFYNTPSNNSSAINWDVEMDRRRREYNNVYSRYDFQVSPIHPVEEWIEEVKRHVNYCHKCEGFIVSHLQEFKEVRCGCGWHCDIETRMVQDFDRNYRNYGRHHCLIDFHEEIERINAPLRERNYRNLERRRMKSEKEKIERKKKEDEDRRKMEVQQFEDPLCGVDL